LQGTKYLLFIISEKARFMPTSEKNLREEFLMKEYEALRDEMTESVKETRSVERNALIVTGAIWSWLAISNNSSYMQLKWLPAILIFLFAYRAYGLTTHIDSLHEYLIKIENLILPGKKLGFEQLHQDRLTAKRTSAYIFWALLIITTIIVPALFNH
jgi:hypothetical protein